MVYAPLKQRGKWAFFEPLDTFVWIGIALTVVLTPLIVFFFEAVFNKSPFYAEDGKLDVLRGLRECVWHSVCHTLSIDVFRVRSFPARIVTVAYAFLVLILTHTYTANLAAFLTVNTLDHSIRSIRDLKGKAVATVPTYADRISQNLLLSPSTVDGWDYDTMIAKLRAGLYAAVISDDTQLMPRAYADDTCSLHLLKESIEPFDLALAFSKSFPSDAFREDVSGALLDMQEDGTISEIRAQYTPEPPRCLETTEFSETNQVQISALWGLWIIMAAATAAAIVSGAVEWYIKRRQKHPDADVIGDRLVQFGQFVSGARHDTARHDAAAAAVAAVCGPGKLSSDAEGTAQSPFSRPPSGHTGLAPDPRRPFALNAARLRHSSVGGGASFLTDPYASRHSTISEDAELPAAAARPHNLSMHSVPSMGHALAGDSASSNEGSVHGVRPEAMAITLPGPPLALAGAQHSQHGSAAAADAGPAAAGQQGGFRSELAEVVSMLRMVTERVNSLQGVPQVNV